MIDEDLPGNVRRNEEYFASTVKEIKSPLVDHVRSGVGFLAGIQLVDPTRAMELYLHCRASGVISRPLIGGAIQISPALSTTREEIDQMVELFNKALNSKS
jgi:acetylornithine/succinyldiaminopimelate/putrescine aminotransferase